MELQELQEFQESGADFRFRDWKDLEITEKFKTTLIASG